MTFKYHILEALMSGVCRITFTKVDGTVRTMNCTRNLEFIPLHARPAKWSGGGMNFKRSENPNSDQVDVFDMDKRQWRSFKMNNIISMDLRPDMDLFETVWSAVRQGYLDSIPPVFVLTEAAVDNPIQGHWHPEHVADPYKY